MDVPQKVTFLVVSSNPYLRGILKFCLETLLHANVTELESEEKALLFLKDLSFFPGMIIYDYRTHAYLLEDFVGYLQKNFKDVKIVILSDEVTDEGRGLLKDISQLTLIEKSLLPGALVEEAKKVFKNTPFNNQDPYCQIDLRFLSILDGVNKNLYVKIGTKYVRLFNEDDNTEAFDIQKYMNKGVKNFYFQRDTALWVLEQMQKQILLFLRSNNFRFVMRGANDSEEKRMQQKILRMNDEVHIDKDFKIEIEQAIVKIRKVMEGEKNVSKLLAKLRENNPIYNYYHHKLMTTAYFACSMSRELEWSSRMTIDKLVFASSLCDLTLAVKPELLKIVSLEQFEVIKETLSASDQKLYLNHPKEGADLIKNYFTTSPPETDVLAIQHHEMPDGSGFPYGLKAERISPLSALFIIANHCATYFMEDEDPSMQDYLLKVEFRFNAVNFRKAYKALEKLKKK
ncbi:MAG: HD-GYP domain-containing protein [Bacteriovoracaceae bacterium]